MPRRTLNDAVDHGELRGHVTDTPIHGVRARLEVLDLRERVEDVAVDRACLHPPVVHEHAARQRRRVRPDAPRDGAEGGHRVRAERCPVRVRPLEVDPELRRAGHVPGREAEVRRPHHVVRLDGGREGRSLARVVDRPDERLELRDAGRVGRPGARRRAAQLDVRRRGGPAGPGAGRRREEHGQRRRHESLLQPHPPHMIAEIGVPFEKYQRPI